MEISIEISPRVDEHGTGSVFHVETDQVDDGSDLTVRLQALKPVTRQECVNALYRATTRLMMAAMIIAAESEQLPAQIRELGEEDEDLAYEMDKAEEAEQVEAGTYDCDYECECSDRGCCAPEGAQCTDACACVAELKAEGRQRTERARAAWETARRELDTAQGRLDEVLDAAVRYVDTYCRDKTHKAVTAAVTGRLCACGCGQPVSSPRPEARYATGACRVRAHRTR